MSLVRQLPFKRRKDAHDSFGRNTRGEQALGGFQKQQILKRKLKRLGVVARGREKSGADEGSDPTVR
jgi:hypothetical protein